MNFLFDLSQKQYNRISEFISKMNKKANRFSLPLIVLTVLEKYKVEKKREQISYFVDYYKVEIKGEIPVLNNWLFVGKIDHVSASKNLVYLFDSSLDIRDYTETDAYCEHCNVNRYRKDTFLLKHKETGEIKKVGRNCLADFIRHTNLERYIDYYSALAEIQKEFSVCEDEDICFSSGNYHQYAYSLFDYLTFVFYFAIRYGYKSKKKAQEESFNSVSTAQIAEDYFFATSEERKKYYEEIDVDKMEKAKDQSKKAIEFMRNYEAYFNSDFEYNLKVICMDDFIHVKNFGFASALFPFYLKKTEFVPTEKKEKNYLGNIGDKLSIKVKIVKVFNFGQYCYGADCTLLYKMIDENENIVVWRTTKDFEQDKGNEYFDLYGTVKEHKVYNGEKQTVMTRCKF